MEQELRTRIGALGAQVEADVISYFGPIYMPLDDLIRHAIESITTRKGRLCVVLETEGGQIETAERIKNIFRHFYDELWFMIPNFAMSAGTVLTMCGDRIFMDYYSVLGPIDPQVGTGNNFVPALGYLQKYNELITKSASGSLTTAEMAYLVERFDPAELYSYEQARDLSIDLLKEWLVQWKFKDWTVTETRRRPVTAKMKKQRAADIAAKLNNTAFWKSHGRGISMEMIKRELNLEIGADQPVNGALTTYYRLLKDYMSRRGHDIVIHTERAYVGL
jgi:membrane-bound ClpP family serine protease